MSYTVSANIPNDLKNWLHEKNASGTLKRDLKKLRVTFGATTDRFWATDSDVYQWKNLPAQMKADISSMTKNGQFTMIPTLVALGMGEDYVLVCQDAKCVKIKWKLDHYPELREVIGVLLEQNKLGNLIVRHIDHLHVI